jgi:very-short-patch-repair endonuclease
MKNKKKKGDWYSPEVKEKQKTLDERKKILKERITPSELVMQGLLLILKPKIGKAIFQKGFIAGNGYCICDFYLPKWGVCIEVDGEYHFTEKQSKIDNYKNSYLTQERKLRLFRITNSEVFDLTPDKLFKLLRATFRQKLIFSPLYNKNSFHK